MDAGINHFVFVSAVLFVLGVYSVVSHKNLLRLLIGIMLMLIAPIINIASFSGFNGFNPEGQLIIFTAMGVCLLLLITGGLLIYNYRKETGLVEFEGEADV